MRWHSHIVAAPPGLTAVIAVPCQPCKLRIMPELYTWHEDFHCWMSETTGLKLKPREYFWLPEKAILETLPC